MEINVVIQNPTALSLRPILGLPILVRTIKVLVSQGVGKIYLETSNPALFKVTLNKFSLNSAVQTVFTPRKARPPGAADQIAFLGMKLGGLPPSNVFTAPSLDQALYLKGDCHYDPDFIGWLLKNKIERAGKVLDRVPAVWWHILKGSDNETGEIEKKLFRNIRDKTEGWIAPTLNKTVSFQITRRLVGKPVTPNVITALNLGVAVLAAFLMTNLSFPLRIAGAVLMQLSSIVDGCDGEVARLKVQKSSSGAWFDTIADDLANHLFMIGICIGIYRTMGDPLYLYGGACFILMSLCISGVIYHQLLTATHSANAKDFRPAWQNENTGKRSWFERVRPLLKRDFFIFVFFLLMIADYRRLLFLIMGASAVIGFIVMMSSFFTELMRKNTPDKLLPTPGE